MRKSKADYEKKNQDNVPSSLRDSFKETLMLKLFSANNIES